MRSGIWYAKNRARQLKLMRLRYRYEALTKPPVVVQCEAILCNNTFVRVHRSRRKWCNDCAAAFYGRSYVLKRARKDQQVA